MSFCRLFSYLMVSLVDVRFKRMPSINRKSVKMPETPHLLGRDPQSAIAGFVASGFGH